MTGRINSMHSSMRDQTTSRNQAPRRSTSHHSIKTRRSKTDRRKDQKDQKHRIRQARANSHEDSDSDYDDDYDYDRPKSEENTELRYS